MSPRVGTAGRRVASSQRPRAGASAARGIRAGVVLTALLLASLTVAATAAGKLVHEEEGTFALGGGWASVAVDNSSGPSAGSVWVGETPTGARLSWGFGRAFQLDADGNPTGVELDASETPAGSFSFASSTGALSVITARLADGIAVDGSAGPNAGDVYVTDLLHGVVDRFVEEAGTGSFVFDCLISGTAPTTAAAEEAECAGSEGSELGGLEPLSVAVDPTTGHLAVGDVSGVVYEFGNGGKLEREISDSHVTEPGSLAFDSSGDLYVANGHMGPRATHGSVVRFDGSGAFQSVVTAGPSLGIGVDTRTDHLYVATETEQTAGILAEYDSTGSLLTTFAAGEKPLSLDAASDTGRVYLTRQQFGGAGEIWSGDMFVPNVTTGEPADIGETTATLTGTVDPEIGEGGSQVESCQFEYGETEAYGATAPCSPAPPYSSATSVSAEAAGLAPATAYHARLTATNAAGNEGHGEDISFTTRGPAAIAGEVVTAGPTSATIRANINPFGYETTCEVQYVNDAAFEESGFATAASAPCDEALGPSFEAEPVSATPRDLEIATGYHFRFVARNQGGITVGEDQTFSTFSIESFSIETLDREGNPYTQAGGHPYEMKVTIALNKTAPLSTRQPESATGNLRTVRVELPPGLIGDPTAAPSCAPYLMKPGECPATSQVGYARIQGARNAPRGEFENGPVFNLVPPRGMAAQLGARFNAVGVARIDASVRTGSDYGIDADTLAVTADEGVSFIEMKLWGVPADEAHRTERFCGGIELGCESNAPLLPFLTNPTSCTGPLTGAVRVDTWQAPGDFVTKTDEMPAIDGCERLRFEPTIAVQPDVDASESPSGLHVDLHVPQNHNPYGLAEANLKDATVHLPAGVAVNPSGANGLEGCSAAQIELHGPNPAACPQASRIGNVEVDTPLLDHPVPGAVYVAAPRDNPFGSLLAIYIAADDPESGVVLKLAGKVTPDPQTGQLTTTFSENPQLPFEDFKLDFFGGPGASLMTPPTCGDYTTTTDMTPWSENGDEHPSDSFSIDSGPNGGACANTPAALPDRQGFTAGTINPVAGDETPFVLNVSRDDGTQRLSRIDTVLPPGLLGKLAGIPYCPEAALAAAARKKGAAELAAPSCPAASRVGSVRVGAGAGPQPYFVSGTAYLAGPYKGAPISLAVVTPAVAGPFDLGTVVVRVALHVDPETAQISAVSDPLPQILEGIPLDVRSIRLQTDITRNPTSCEPMSVDGTAFSTLGEASPLSERFQVGSCAELGFKPRLFTRLFGRTRRGGNPSLRTVLTMPSSGQANIARAAVTLPHSEFLDQSHIGTVCTRVQYAAHACPPDSIYGYAKAWSPLLDQPLEGPVYLRSSSHELPDLVASLDGQIHIDLDGRIDSVHGGIRTIFAAVPDAPVSKFMLSMKGGKKGLLENSTDICAKVHRAVARFSGHNGARSTSKPKLKASCGSRRKHTRHGRRP